MSTDESMVSERDRKAFSAKTAVERPVSSPELTALALGRLVKSQAAKVVPVPPTPKYGRDRNKPCFCGSGKKFKNCHLKSQEQEIQTLIKEQRQLREAQVAKAHLLKAYEQCLRGTHTLIAMGLAESPEAESLRQQSEEIWVRLSPEEQAHFRKLSAELSKISMPVDPPPQ